MMYDLTKQRNTSISKKNERDSFQIIIEYVNNEHIVLLKPKSMFTELQKKK